MTAFDFLKNLPYLPSSKEGCKTGRPSNSEIRRWLISHSVVINGIKPLPDDEVKMPITELIFFPKSPLKTTMA